MVPRKLAVGLIIFFVLSLSVNAALLDTTDIGFSSQTRINNYDTLINSLYANGNVTTVIDGDTLWVPWFDSSTACGLTNLKSGSSCNSGEAIDFTHNCMVTDEFSQVGVLVAVGNNQTRMDHFVNTLEAISSTYGQLPAWRIYRDGDSIEPCRSGINGNCDTASDATARIIIALYTAADNTRFSDEAKKDEYRALADALAEDFLQYEVDQTCRASSLAYGDICYWMAAGSGAKSGGIASTDYGYTGYYADGIIAMLAACASTNDPTYCAVAGNFTLNYLQAANYTGASFRVPPGRSFKWVTSGGIPIASCTNTCGPDQWDSADAPRAFGMCQALTYAENMDIELPLLAQYCAHWSNRHFNNTNSVYVRYTPDGAGAGTAQSGYFAQGLQALAQAGGHAPSLFESTLDNALGHYSTSTKTWDNTACFGVYNQAFAVRALGFGIGLDEDSFTPIEAAAQEVAIASSYPVASSIGITEDEDQTFNVTLANPDGVPVNIGWFVDGENQTLAFDDDTFAFLGTTGEGSYNVTVQITADTTVLARSWTLSVTQAGDGTEPIAFSSVYPSASTASVNAATNQSFTFTLSNPSALATTVSWLVDGTYQEAAFGDTTFLVLGNDLDPGTYNVTVRVVSAENIIANSWSVTVNATEEDATPLQEDETPPASAAAAGGGGGGGGGVAPSLESPSITDSSSTPVAGAPAPSASEIEVSEDVAAYAQGSDSITPVDLVRAIWEYYGVGDAS